MSYRRPPSRAMGAVNLTGLPFVAKLAIAVPVLAAQAALGVTAELGAAIARPFLKR